MIAACENVQGRLVANATAFCLANHEVSFGFWSQFMGAVTGHGSTYDVFTAVDVAS